MFDRIIRAAANHNRVAIYFDMDGVLFDWVDMFNRVCDIPLAEFNAMSREEREVVKREIFDFDFFANMNVIPEGVALLRECLNIENADVYILSASGRVNRDSVIAGKLEAIEALAIPEIVRAMFVDKVEMKASRMRLGYDVHILIDDRNSAIDAWNAANGVGILFE